MTNVHLSLDPSRTVQTRLGLIPSGTFFEGRVSGADYGLYYAGRDFCFKVGANGAGDDGISWSKGTLQAGRYTYANIPVADYKPVENISIRLEA